MGDFVGSASARPPELAERLLPTWAEIRPEDIYAGLALPEGPTDRPYVVLNMVATVDGQVAIGGRASGIGSRLDRALMRRIRAACDAVMVGAATLRAERVDPSVPDELAEARAARGLPPRPMAVAISATLDLDPSWRFFRHGPDRTLVLTTTTAPRDRAEALAGSATVERIGGDSVDLVEALARLRGRYGVERLVVEGGPTLNRQLVALGLVDELFLTLAPKLAGGGGPSILGGGGPAEKVMAELELASLHRCAGELFFRYRVAHG